MSELEKARQDRNDLINKIEAFKKDGNENRTAEERKERNENFVKMIDDLSVAQKTVKQLEIIDSAKRQKEQEEEFNVRKVPNNSGGDLKFRKYSWHTKVTDESEQPSTDEIRARDELVWQRFKDADSLTTDERITAHRMYAGERLFYKFISGGADSDKVRMSVAEMEMMHEYQARAQPTTAQIGQGVDGGFLIPTITEAAIVHEMAFIGPWAGPMGGAGMWMRYDNGQPHKINVNISRRKAKADYVAEGADIAAKKAGWGQKTLNFHTIANLMPWTIQIQQDSASNLEQELRMEMSESFGRFLNDELTTLGDGSRTKLDSVTNGLLNANTITTKNAYNAPAAAGQYTTESSNIRPSEIIAAKYKIDKAYRGVPNFHMQASDYVMLTLEQIVDGENRFLYHRPEEGGPLMVHNMRTYTNNGFATAAASTVNVALGDFNKFRIGYVRGMYVTVFRELFMQSLQLGLMAYWRVGSVHTDNRAIAGIEFKA